MGNHSPKWWRSLVSCTLALCVVPYSQNFGSARDTRHGRSYFTSMKDHGGFGIEGMDRNGFVSDSHREALHCEVAFIA